MGEAFNILTIDGGGVRGIFPAKFLTNLEERLKEQGNDKTQIFQHFDLVAGTSTGGIIAIGLALGIPAKEMYDLYMSNAAGIFGDKRPWYQAIQYAKYKRDRLESCIRELYKSRFNGEDPRLEDVKVPVCVPIFDLLQGKPSVLKSKYHPRFNRDYHIPAYQAALATSAAPTYFDPYTGAYQKLNSEVIEPFSNKIDGGVFANNPTLLALIEAQKAFKRELNEIRVLSIGTGSRKYSDANSRKFWGVWYWFPSRRIIDLFTQSQSQHTSNLISLLQKGIDGTDGENFKYLRIDTLFDAGFDIALDETDPDKLKALSEKATVEFQNHGNAVIDMFCRK